MDRPHGHHSINTEDEPLFHFDLHEQQSEDNVQPTDVLFNEIATSPGVAQAETSGSPTRSSPRDVKGKGPASNLPPIRIPPGQASRSTSSRAFSPGPIHYGSFSDRPSWDVPGSLTSAASTSFGTSALRTPSDHDDFMQQFATMGFDYGSNGGHISASPVFEFSEGKGKGRAAMPTPALGRLEEASNRTAPSTILTQPDIPSSPSNSTLDTTVARSPSVFGPPPASQPRYPGTPPPESLRTRSRQTIGRYRIQGGRSFTETRGRKFSEGDAYQQQPTEGDSSQLHPSSLTCRHNRSYSSPPFSPFDLALSTHTAPIQPIPFVPRGLFGEMLPRELQLRVFAALLQLYEIEHLERISSSDWTCEKAGSRKYQWVGRSKGMRELVKFSRVSKAWKTLAFDGELWGTFPVPPPAQLSSKSMLGIAEVTGSLMTTLTFPGQNSLRNSVLVRLTDLICIKSIEPHVASYTQITSVDLSFCRKLSSSRTPGLHHLVLRAPSLRSLKVRGLSAVTNMTCSLLALYCPLLQNLDISRCGNVSGEGLRAMASRAEMQGRPLVLKRLLACGIAAIDDNALRALGKVTPFLEVLDLSYTRLHNSALDAFVTCDVDQHHKHPTILLTAAQAGRSSGTQDFYRRRLTKLRHLNLSACTLLTDSACTSLAYTMPDLECLELANIGTSVKDDGVIRLFRTTPALKKLDLEGASSIGDAVVVALTPPLVDIEDDLVAIPQLGSALEHLSLSHVNRVTSEVLSALILACARLRVLEIDETRISGRVMKDFVRLSRERKILSSKLVAGRKEKAALCPSVRET